MISIAAFNDVDHLMNNGEPIDRLLFTLVIYDSTWAACIVFQRLDNPTKLLRNIRKPIEATTTTSIAKRPVLNLFIEIFSEF